MAVFRYYGADGTYLYGGITANPKGTLASHLRKKDWWSQVARRELIRFSSLDEALRAEETHGRGLMGRQYRTYKRPSHPNCAHLTYHMTCEEYDQMISGTGHRCQICGHVPTDSTSHLNIDHDHALGYRAVRGLVCTSCNLILHFVEKGNRRPTDDERRFLANPWHQRAEVASYGCPENCAYGSHR